VIYCQTGLIYLSWGRGKVILTSRRDIWLSLSQMHCLQGESILDSVCSSTEAGQCSYSWDCGWRSIRS